MFLIVVAICVVYEVIDPLSGLALFLSLAGDGIIRNNPQVGDEDVLEYLISEGNRIVLELVNGVSAFLHDISNHLGGHGPNVLATDKLDSLLLQGCPLLVLGLHLLDGLLDDSEEEAVSRHGRLLAAGDDVAEYLGED